MVQMLHNILELFTSKFYEFPNLQILFLLFLEEIEGCCIGQATTTKPFPSNPLLSKELEVYKENFLSYHP